MRTAPGRRRCSSAGAARGRVLSRARPGHQKSSEVRELVHHYQYPALQPLSTQYRIAYGDTMVKGIAVLEIAYHGAQGILVTRYRHFRKGDTAARTAPSLRSIAILEIMAIPR